MCEVFIDMFEKVKFYMFDVVYCRVKYIIIENVCILSVSIVLKNGDIVIVSEVMVVFYVLMWDDFEIIVLFIDYFVKIIYLFIGNIGGVWMMGGGFGGCVVVLVFIDCVNDVK